MGAVNTQPPVPRGRDDRSWGTFAPGTRGAVPRRGTRLGAGRGVRAQPRFRFRFRPGKEEEREPGLRR